MNSTQAVYDLAVEATAKAGPWSLDQGPGENVATYVVLSGANGPIEGETIVFSTTGGDVSVVTDSSGHAAWPADATAAAVESPGDTYIGDEDPASPGADIQDMLVTFGQTLERQYTDPPATTTTTTTAAPTTTTHDDDDGCADNYDHDDDCGAHDHDDGCADNYDHDRGGSTRAGNDDHHCSDRSSWRC